MNSVQSSGHTTSLNKKKDSQFEVRECVMWLRKRKWNRKERVKDLLIMKDED
jgi:hypothetical protein